MHCVHDAASAPHSASYCSGDSSHDTGTVFVIQPLRGVHPGHAAVAYSWPSSSPSSSSWPESTRCFAMKTGVARTSRRPGVESGCRRWVQLQRSLELQPRGRRGSANVMVGTPDRQCSTRSGLRPRSSGTSPTRASGRAVAAGTLALAIANRRQQAARVWKSPIMPRRALPAAACLQKKVSGDRQPTPYKKHARDPHARDPHARV